MLSRCFLSTDFEHCFSTVGEAKPGDAVLYLYRAFSFIAEQGLALMGQIENNKDGRLTNSMCAVGLDGPEDTELQWPLAGLAPCCFHVYGLMPLG